MTQPDEQTAAHCARAVSRQDPWHALSTLTPARIGLGRSGGSLPTQALLAFQLAHAQARDAVSRALDSGALAERIAVDGRDALLLHSAAPDRATFIARPDLGRILDERSRCALEARPPTLEPIDCAFVIADGLSAPAVEKHAPALLSCVADRMPKADWNVAPVIIVQQGRVAIGDEIGALLGARMAVMLIGERPGLSSPDSLGVYLTYDPVPGRTNAERNCISNIRTPGGLSYDLAAHKLYHLMREARRRKLSGIELKEDAPQLENETIPSGCPRP